MPVYRIPKALVFPDPAHAEPNGLLGVGGDLSPERLLLGYASGIFPWFNDDNPILWWSPDPRMVLFTAELHVPRSLAKIVRRGDFQIRMDTAFTEVVRHCGETERPRQDSTWITEGMAGAYARLHELGFAHSVEAWRDGELVGGLYGVAVGRFFSGESMFAHAPDASKVAFVHLATQLRKWGFPLIDCQVHTAHLDRFGAREIPRDDYLAELGPLVAMPHRAPPWTFDPDLRDGVRVCPPGG
jgi:leucyl/phenylalanyl-tRNA---protein transferase